MDYANERYVRLYTRDTKTWCLLGWEGQALLGLLLRKVDRAGLLEDVFDADDVLVLLGNGMPLEVIEIGLDRLVKRCVLERTDRGLIAPNFIEAQETAQSNRQRNREWRAKRRDRALESGSSHESNESHRHRDETSAHELTKRPASVTPRARVGTATSGTARLGKEGSGSEGGSGGSVDHATEASGPGVRAGNGEPRNLDDALGVPIGDRAAFARRNPHVAEWLEPHRWPEVVRVAEALGGKRQRLGASRDRGVEAVVALYADGFTEQELLRVAHALPESEWWAKGKRGLSSLTPEVVRRSLADLCDDELSPEAQRILDRIQEGKSDAV